MGVRFGIRRSKVPRFVFIFQIRCRHNSPFRVIKARIPVASMKSKSSSMISYDPIFGDMHSEVNDDRTVLNIF